MAGVLILKLLFTEAVHGRGRDVGRCGATAAHAVGPIRHRPRLVREVLAAHRGSYAPRPLSPHVPRLRQSTPLQTQSGN